LTRKVFGLARIAVHFESDQVFTLNQNAVRFDQNRCSAKTRMGVHFAPEFANTSKIH